MLKAAGTVEEYEAKADSIKESLRQELRCFLPTCTLTVTVEAGSVILTVVATDTVGATREVESAAVALQEKRLDVMSSVLGITIEEVPAAPSARAVQVQVMRLAPSPPPPSRPRRHPRRRRTLAYPRQRPHPPTATRRQPKTPAPASRLGSRLSAACSRGGAGRGRVCVAPQAPDADANGLIHQGSAASGGDSETRAVDAA